MPKTVQSPEGRVEELEAEVEELERRRTEALAQIQRSEVRFGELEERRIILAPKTFSGDKKAALELEGLEDAHDQLTRSVRVARSAVPQFERMLEEAEARAKEAREEIHRERYKALIGEADALTPELEGLAKGLAVLLEKRDALYFDAGEELRYFDGERANNLSRNLLLSTGDFLDGVLSQWLPPRWRGGGG